MVGSSLLGASSPSQLKVFLRFFSSLLFNYSLPETHDRAFIFTIATLSFSLRPSALYWYGHDDLG